MILGFLTKYRGYRARVHTGPGGDTSTSYNMVQTKPAKHQAVKFLKIEMSPFCAFLSRMTIKNSYNYKASKYLMANGNLSFVNKACARFAHQNKGCARVRSYMLSAYSHSNTKT